MPHRILNLAEAADCLHLSAAEIERLVKRGEIPSETRGRRVVFRKVEIEAWASQRILGADAKTRARAGHTLPAGTVDVSAPEFLLPGLVAPGQVAAALPARTKASVLREMTSLAARTGWIGDPRQLVARLEEREALSSTAMPGGVALLHTPVQDACLFERSFVALGRTVQPIHFGAPDARPTNLFFLVCSRDAQRHLVLLSRLCRLALETAVLAHLRNAPDAAAMHECLLAAERETLGTDSADEPPPFT